MNRFGMWFANLMRGRYGTDNLNRFLLIVAFAVIIIDMFLRWRILDLVTVALLIYVYCRMFSRNINARYRENQKFLQFTAKFRKGRSGGGYGSSGGYSGGSYGGNSSGGSYGNSGNTGGFGGFGGAGRTKDKTHKILRCPGCGEKLRVPKGAGKINISCPHCGTKFVKKV